MKLLLNPKSERQSGLELLRIVAMLGIVLSHWGGHGSWILSADNTLIVNKIWMQLCQYFGEVGNCVFFLITGYFSYGRDKINKKGIIRLIIDVKFYAFIVWAIVLLFGLYPFSIGGLTKSLFPIVYRQYWFVLPFLAVCAISPWINDILNKSSKETLKWFFGLFILIEMLLPLIGATTIASNVGLYILVYSIGAIIRKEGKIFNIVSHCRWYLVGGGFFIAILSIFLLDILCERFCFSCDISMILIERFSFLPIFVALGLFLIFNRINIWSKVVNYLSQSVLSVYLISEHPYVHPWFWKSTFDNLTHYNTVYLIPMSIFHCLIVLVGCIIIDVLYRTFKDFLLMRLINQHQII